jgi:aryl-alcohol dehydrogenase-like predicted oxidoreductase
MPYSPLARGFLTGKYRRGVKVESIRASEVQENYANDRGFALIDEPAAHLGLTTGADLGGDGNGRRSNEEV